MPELEIFSRFVNDLVSAVIFLGCVVLVAAFWLH